MCYVGSTTKSLEQRLERHCGDFKRWDADDAKVYVTSFEIVKHENPYITLWEDLQNVTKQQLYRKEGEYIKNTVNCVNKYVAGRTVTEYYQVNKDIKIAKSKAYYEANKEAVTVKKKEHYNANRDDVIAKSKAYNEANKDAVTAKKKVHYKVNRDVILTQKKAYYEANKDVISAKRAERRRLKNQKDNTVK